MRIRSILGVDFSGAALAGRNAWIARCVPPKGRARWPIELVALDRLETLAGDAKRDVALPWLVDAIRTSPAGSLWAIDFPFGLPIELGFADWPAQIDAVKAWTRGAHDFGVECCRRATESIGKLHVRRDTDRETRTPFDCYHYRIVYQMYHGMRDVLAPLRDDASVCILPFEFGKLPSATRVVIEACPGSTLRRLKLPHNRYKQSTPGRVLTRYRKTRDAIFAGLGSFITMDETFRRTIMNNPGGDALDAVLAAVGAQDGWHATDWAAVARHPRYGREGLVVC